ncbi:MAG: phosphoglycerate dehydrogenase [Rubrivivax sp.]|jgi:D-3-phosphoglycerate dehydrogenase|nr:phosphoglycerate dehydrogenase [Rubrivivax sp.]MBP6319822.1 phosphoglycerate dehydrogenase [Rubrivivax sp.]MBP6465317.1 phosphoglycerate dehydrogenase [Rubrivivax sp.]MCU0963649.1 phosphoglycerate dehydrogenase [Burkholderiaceae bacterium]
MSLNILLLEDVHASATPILSALPAAEVVRLKHAPGAEELKRLLADVQVLGLRSRTALTPDVLVAAPRLLAVGAYCTGTNNIDLSSCAGRGVAVFNGPFSNTRSVAELVIGHAIHLLRRIPERQAAARRGQWLKDARGSNEIRGKTLGIVGYGKIGTQTGLLAEAIGMRVLFHDVEARLPLGNARSAGALDALLQEADVVTLHVPQTEQTRHLIDAARLAQMRPDAVLINLARGHAVDIDALHAALRSGHLRGAAIDVFPVEPASSSETFESPLRDLDNVILTPHVGGSTVEAQSNLGIEVSEKLRDYLTLGAVRGSVNLPELSAGPLRSASRLVHLHHDQPGVMSRLNGVLAAAGLNVTQMHLETAASMGAAVVDLNAPLDAATLAEVQRVDGSVRAFVALGGVAS